jgi:beta-galactosidase
MNAAGPTSAFAQVMDVISLNYQGEGIRDTNPYSNLVGIHTTPLYVPFHEAFPERLIISSETASALSSRGAYIFPVINDISAPVNDTSGGNSTALTVSSYELYTANFGASPDKVFRAQDNNTFVGGEFVWSGFDYLGEPTPYDDRSSYSGIIDLAGFKKDRFFLYQAHWRPELKMAHILPHWNWPDRVGLVTPVHIFSSGDEAELFLNGVSQGKLTKAPFTYRFRFDQVIYQPGELSVVTWKNGQLWANATVRTTGPTSALRLTPDRSTITGDGLDLSFITAEIIDSNGDVVGPANNNITFSITGPGEIVATDNGAPFDFVPFPSQVRSALSGLALAIVRATPGGKGVITVSATGDGLGTTKTVVHAK